MINPTLGTKRLIIRPLKKTDLKLIYNIIDDDRLTKYLNFSNPTDELTSIKKWINNIIKNDYDKWIITLKDSSTPIGYIGVHEINKNYNYCTIGCVILNNYWQNGYATEATTEVSNFLLKEQHFDFIEASCHEKNIASSKTLLKSGFKKDIFIANKIKNNDGTYSGVEYYSKKLRKVSN